LANLPIWDGLESLRGVIYNRFLFTYLIIKLFSGFYTETEGSNKKPAILKIYKDCVKAGFQWCMEERFRVGPAVDRKWYYSKKESIIFPPCLFVFLN
jgi:hypothetical protein|tara:strand:+ start:350 stop:640 length:291 start_codon:yes stop_codon:yes gene_type:complete